VAQKKFKERNVVKGLRKSSKEFNHFYQEERVKRNGFPIKWIQNPELKKGIKAEANLAVSTSTGKEFYTIYFRDFPNVKDDLVFAHEIVHIIRAKEKKVLIIRVNDKSYSFLAGALMNMFEDPLVDEYLKNYYKFDLLTNYKERLRHQKEQLVRLDEEPIQYSGKLDCMINFSKIALCWNLIKDQDEHQDWIDYKISYEDKLPNVWKMSTYFLSIIEGIGFDSLDKQERIVKEFMTSFIETIYN